MNSTFMTFFTENRAIYYDYSYLYLYKQLITKKKFYYFHLKINFNLYNQIKFTFKIKSGLMKRNKSSIANKKHKTLIAILI